MAARRRTEASIFPTADHHTRHTGEICSVRNGEITSAVDTKTNGKAERFIQTALREWAYAQAYPNSNRRVAELPIWLHRYNWHRPHSAIKSKPPISRLGLTEDDLLRLHS